MQENIITVVDAPCGYGKTTWAIQEMNAVERELPFVKLWALTYRR